jgi:hypothetical protein
MPKPKVKHPGKHATAVEKERYRIYKRAEKLRLSGNMPLVISDRARLDAESVADSIFEVRNLGDL